MKRLTAILLTAVLMMTFLTGCGKGRQLYSKANLEDYVEVGEYLGIEVDTTTDEFKEYYDETFKYDIEDYGLYKDVTDDTVANGDIVNLDYEGKIDGVAFDGGTATGADLEIGSGTFIDDFEEELIGVAIGETKDVTAKFPENYGKEELNGKEAIFTCKINSIARPMTVEEAYSEMDFDSAEDYEADIKKRAIKNNILDIVRENSKISDYPQDDSQKICDAIYEINAEGYKQTYNVEFETALAQSGYTVETYKQQISTNMVPQMMNVNMIMYYILDVEELELLESTVQSQTIDQPVIAESYAVQDIVMEYLYENAEIK